MTKEQLISRISRLKPGEQQDIAASAIPGISKIAVVRSVWKRLPNGAKEFRVTANGPDIFRFERLEKPVEGRTYPDVWDDPPFDKE